MSIALNFSSPSFQVTESSHVSTETDKTLRICVTAILGVIMVLTILGNGLVCLVSCRQPQLQRVPYYPIISLALADILCGICAMPAYIAKKHFAGGVGERITCDGFRFTYFFSVYASILSLTAVSVERLLAIKAPVWHRMFLTSRKMIVVLMFFWLEAALVSMLPFFWREEETEESCTYRPSREWSILVILLNVCFPFVITFTCHFYTVKFAIRFSRQKYKAKISSREDTSEKNSTEYKHAILLERRERDITCTMAKVLGAFILCWAPSTFYYFVQMICPQCYGRSFDQIRPVFNAVVKLLTFVNSCLNPFIYCWSNLHFRQAFFSLKILGARNKTSTVEMIGLNGQGAVSR
ncbi:D(3) dopamine receptor-like [Dendronephthya gigantea]|uniref:D(3) dopamine receptor-like n=1 Tax=Dendronephthya gigantea TaxID=151771 RepID=UPI00106D22FB|nr:D(3) dopamine receptor-like [Dendronephthya gigantea]